MLTKPFGLLIAIIVFGSLLFVTNAHARGFGFYLGHFEGYTRDDSNESREFFNTNSVDVNAGSYGIVLDTNLSQPETFNYRLSLGYEDLKLPSGHSGWRISFDHTFGFKLVQNESLRLWLGPSLHFSAGQWDLPSASQYNGNLYYSDGVEKYLDVFGIGVGPMLGINYHIPGMGSICTELGFRVQGNLAEDYNIRNYSAADSDSYDLDGANFSYLETVFFAKVSLIFGN